MDLTLRVARASEARGEHIGLSMMARRAVAIGAEFQAESEPGEGTRILPSFQLPIGE